MDLPNFIDSAELQMCTDDSCETVSKFRIGDSETDSTAEESVDGVLADDSSDITFKRKLVFYRDGLHALQLKIYLKEGVILFSDSVYFYLYCTPVPLTGFFEDDSLELNEELNDSTKAYSVTVENEKDEMVFQPTCDDLSAHVIFNGERIPAGTETEPCSLSIGENTFTFITVASDTSVLDTFTLSVLRKASTDARLESIEIEDVTLAPEFKASKTSYSATVANRLSATKVEVVTAHSGATVRCMLDSVEFDNGDALDLKVGENEIIFEVTAEDSVTSEVYVVKLTRTRSTIATLDSLTPSKGTFEPSFNSKVKSYEIEVENSIDAVSFDIEKTDKNAAVEILEADSAGEIALKSYATTTIHIVVTAEDESTDAVYEVKVWRDGSGDASLSSISASTGELFPEELSDDRNNYEIRVPADSNKVAIKVTPSNKNAKVKIEDNLIEAGKWSATKTVEKQGITENVFRIEVTPENESDPKVYKISVNRAFYLQVLSDGNGSIKPTDTIDAFEGVSVSIEAKARTGSVLEGWELTDGIGTIKDSTADSTTVEVESNSTLYAHFKLKTYTLKVDQVAHGTVNAPSKLKHGVSGSIEAIPDEGYDFNGWSTDSGSVVFDDSTEKETEITLEQGDAVIQAAFKIKTYDLTLRSGGEGHGKTEGPEQLEHNDTGLIRAIPDTGYLFKEWVITEGSATIGNTDDAFSTIVLTGGSAAVTAEFEAKRFLLTLSAEGQGSVSGPDTVKFGISAAITATPEEHHHLVRWEIVDGEAEIEDSTDETTDISLSNGDATLRARFAIDTYPLVITSTDSGTVSGSGDVEHGARNDIAAHARKGFRFVGWELVEGNAVITDDEDTTTSVVLTDGAATVQAVFERLPYKLILRQTENGTIDNSTDSDTLIVLHGLPTSINATPATGYHLEHWVADSNGTSAHFADEHDASTTVILTDGNAVISGEFTINRYPLVLGTTGQGTIEARKMDNTLLEDGESVVHGDTINLTAVAEPGSHFTNWVTTGNMTIQSTTLPATPVNIFADDASIKARFEKNTYYVELKGSDNGSITGQYSNPVTHGEEYQVTAEPADGYYFEQWGSVNRTVMFTDPASEATTMIPSGNDSIFARFAQKTYRLSVSRKGNGTVNFEEGTVIWGAVTTLTATPLEGNRFVRWEINTGIPSFQSGSFNEYNPTLQIILDSTDVEMEANFELMQYSLIAGTSGAGGSGSYIVVPDSVTYDRWTSIKAVPSIGASFLRWDNVSGDNVDIENPTSAPTRVRATGPDPEIQAVFEMRTYTLSIGSSDSVYGISGTVSPAPPDTTVTHGVAVRISAAANVGYKFTRWIALGAQMNPFLSSTDVTLTNGDASVEAQFALRRYGLSWQVAPQNGGDVDVPDSVYHFASDSIFAYPRTGYHFVEWTRSGTGVTVGDMNSNSTNARTVVSMTADDSLTANFALNKYLLEVLPDPDSGGTSSTASDLLEHGIPYEIQATAYTDSGYHFVEWNTVNGVVTFGDRTEDSTTIILTEGDAQIQPQFALNQYSLTKTVADTSATITGPDVFEHGISQEVKVEVKHPYRFVRWEQVGNVAVDITTPENCSTLVTLSSGDAEIQAIYELKRYPIHLSCSPSEGGTVIPETDTITHGLPMDIRVEINGANEFGGWQFVDGVSSAADYEFEDSDSTSTRITVYPSEPAPGGRIISIQANVTIIQE